MLFSETIGDPVFGKGLTIISARNRVVQIASGGAVQMAGVTVNEDDFVIADRCGSVFIPTSHIGEVLDLGDRIAKRQDGSQHRIDDWIGANLFIATKAISANKRISPPYFMTSNTVRTNGATISGICSSVMINGGASRIWSPCLPSRVPAIG